jgi:hypothetical protein
MNERIKQLATEARLLTGWSVGEVEYQKFAELIVRECADVCNNLDTEYEGEDVLATWCAKSIKEHFGIEE